MVIVILNFYVGCNAVQRESGVYAHVAQIYYNQYGQYTVALILSLKGGSTCGHQSNIYQIDSKNLFPGIQVRPEEMPLTLIVSIFLPTNLYGLEVEEHRNLLLLPPHHQEMLSAAWGQHGRGRKTWGGVGFLEGWK